MTLSPELQARLERQIERRDEYRYEGADVNDKTFVGVIAPSAVGKSTVITEILRQCAERGIDAAEVGSITTRERRPDGSDPANYRTATEGITHEGLIHQIERGELINWSYFATGDLYATDAASYPAKYNFLPLQPDSLEMLKKAGFRVLVAVYLTAPTEEWKERLTERRGDPKFRGRVVEAISSLEFAKAHLDTLSIINNPSVMTEGEIRPVEAAQKILDISLGREAAPNDPEAIRNIDDMLAYARNLKEETDGTTA